MSAIWGNKFRITIFGESHGECIGAVIDGVPPGIEIDMEEVNVEMNRRAPGNSSLSTSRKEKDKPEIMSGVFNGKTTGAPLAFNIKNSDTISKDYSKIKDIMRPGHSDYTSYKKYDGFNDYRGGGHFSGRITAPLVFAGAIAKQILSKKGIRIGSHIYSVADVNDDKFDLEYLLSDNIESKLIDLKKNELPLINTKLKGEIYEKIETAKSEGDSVGGVIECAILGVDAGIGDPFFNSIESSLSSILFSIPSVKGVEFGSGFDISKMRGSESNDSFYYDSNGNIKTRTNHNGGITGGITNGMPILFRVAIKPPASIQIEQESINIFTKKNDVIKVGGRHDPIIVPRAIPVIESVAAISILDFIL